MAVYKRGNYWYARLYWRDNKKKRHTKSKGHFKTKKQASIWEANALSDLSKGFNIKADPIFVDYFWQQFNLYRKNKVRFETERAYGTAKKVLKSYFQDTRIKEITRDDWQRFLNYLGANYARTSIKTFLKKYHPVIISAIQDGIIKIDFTKNTIITGSKKRTRLDKVKMLSVGQIKELIQLAIKRRRITEKSNCTNFKGNICDYVILTILFTGMRVGEAIGLQWQDIDFKNNKIHICHSYNSDTHILGPVKTFTSNRIITVNSQLLDVLKELMANHTDYVFGIPIRKNLPPNKHSVNGELHRMLRKLNIPDAGFTVHTLRHCHVALLYYWGADIYEIKDRLGHSSITTTLDTYGYLIDEKKKPDTKVITDGFNTMM